MVLIAQQLAIVKQVTGILGISRTRIEQNKPRCFLCVNPNYACIMNVFQGFVQTPQKRVWQNAERDGKESGFCMKINNVNVSNKTFSNVENKWWREKKTNQNGEWLH